MEQVRSSIRRGLSRNLGLKVFSVCVGVSLWLFIGSEQSIDKIMEVPVEIVNKPSDVEIANPFLKRVLLHVRCPQIQGDALSKSIVATIDLSQAHLGENTFPLTSEAFKLPDGIKILNIRPASIMLDLEPMKVRPVPIRIRYAGTPRTNFVTRGVEAVPSMAMISGPASHVDKVESLDTQVIDITGLTHDIQQDVHILTDSTYISILTSSTAKGIVRINEVTAPVALTRLPIRARGGEAARVQPKDASVVVEAPVSVKDSIDASDLDVYVEIPGGGVKPGSTLSLPVRAEFRSERNMRLLKIVKVSPTEASVVVK